MLRRVGQALLHDPVRRQVDGRGQRSGPPVAQPHGQPGGPGGGQQGGEAVQPVGCGARLALRARPQQLDHGPHLAERGHAVLADRLQDPSVDRRVVPAEGRGGLQGDGRHAPRDGVVQVPGHPVPLVGERGVPVPRREQPGLFGQVPVPADLQRPQHRDAQQDAEAQQVQQRLAAARGHQPAEGEQCEHAEREPRDGPRRAGARVEDRAVEDIAEHEQHAQRRRPGEDDGADEHRHDTGQRHHRMPPAEHHRQAGEEHDERRAAERRLVPPEQADLRHGPRQQQPDDEMAERDEAVPRERSVEEHRPIPARRRPARLRRTMYATIALPPDATTPAAGGAWRPWGTSIRWCG